MGRVAKWGISKEGEVIVGGMKVRGGGEEGSEVGDCGSEEGLK